MSWTGVKRWLQQRRRKSRHEKFDMLQLESAHQRAATHNKTAELLPSVFVKDYGYIPLVVVNAAFVIEKNIRTKGLFQTRGTATQAMTKLMTRSKSSSLNAVDVHDAVDALKTSLVSLADPLLPDQVLEALISVPRKDSSGHYVFVLREFRKCSPRNFAILHFVLTLLNKVSQNALHNGADVQTLAVIFVFDVIRPLMRENSETRVSASDSMQRLPFLIMVMETLIESPDLFKMAATVGDDPRPEIKREKDKAETMPPAKGRSKVEPKIGSWSSDKTYTRSLGTEAPLGYGIPTINVSACRVEATQTGSPETADASAPDNPAVIISLNSRDSPGNVQGGQILQSVSVLESVVHSGRNLLVAADTPGSPSREGILKTSKFNSSPGEKPVRTTRLKKSAITRRQRAAKYTSNKRVASEDVQERLSDSSLNSDFGTLLLREDNSGWTEEVCGTDDTNSIMPTTCRCPQVIAVKTSASQKPQDLTDCDTIGKDTFNSSQTFPAGQEQHTSNGQDFLTLTTDAAAANITADSVIQNTLETDNIGMKMSTAARKGIKPRRKGKLSLKKNRKKSGNLNNGSPVSGGPRVSISPPEVDTKDPQLSLEQISQTSSRMLFSPSTEDNKRTFEGTNIRDPTIGDSRQESPGTNIRDPTIGDSRQESPGAHLQTTPECENNVGYSAFANRPGCCGRHASPSCSPGICGRHASPSCSPGCSEGYAALSCSPGCSGRHASPSCSPGCSEGYAAPSCSPGCSGRHAAPSCSPGCCDRLSAGSGVLFCDSTRHSDTANFIRYPPGANNAHSFESINDQQHPSKVKATEDTISLARSRNEVQVRNRNPCTPCTPCLAHTPKDIQQIIIVKVFNDPRRTLTRAKVRTAANRSSLGTQRPQNGAQPEQSSMGSFLENIFLISIALFIISLVLYHHSNNSHQDDWSQL